MKLGILIGLTLALVISGCISEPGEHPKDRLVGKWRSEMISTEWGLAAFEMVFHANSKMEFRMIPKEGQAINHKGAFRIQGDKIFLDFLKPDDFWKYRFEGKNLVIQSGDEPAKHFKRI